MRGTVPQRRLAGQWTEAGLLLNSCWTAKVLGRQLLHALPAGISPELAQGRTGW